ncbi:hypothetical protein evm_011613 [Chilo suppressalis]|nr:hypothetical protein evm_011613 [Chilo suppressalis]
MKKIPPFQFGVPALSPVSDQKKSLAFSFSPLSTTTDYRAQHRLKSESESESECTLAAPIDIVYKVYAPMFMQCDQIQYFTTFSVYFVDFSGERIQLWVDRWVSYEETMVKLLQQAKLLESGEIQQ